MCLGVPKPNVRFPRYKQPAARAGRLCCEVYMRRINLEWVIAIGVLVVKLECRPRVDVNMHWPENVIRQPRGGYIETNIYLLPPTTLESSPPD
jgi:hypothetical protein